ncbi:hypothetical protein CsatA_019556 [Cannabis sativa]
MKILSWMQSKLKYGKHNENNCKKTITSKPFPQAPVVPVLVQQAENSSGKEEVNDWLYGLLAIGTLGNNDINKEDLYNADPHHHETINKPPPPPSSSSNLLLRDPICEADDDDDKEEDGSLELQIDLKSLILMHDKEAAAGATGDHPSLERFLSRQSQSILELCKSSTSNNTSGTTLALNRGKDVTMDNTTKNAIVGKKSFSFLLKKIFVCSSGFPNSPPTPKSPTSEQRMEKILRAILHKKIYPQGSSNPSLSMKKYIENRHNEDDLTDEQKNAVLNGSKWVKTDSECN